nr:MAG TPA: hypothetical protein [Caudoviricetes sp.]
MPPDLCLCKLSFFYSPRYKISLLFFPPGTLYSHPIAIAVAKYVRKEEER